MTVLFLLLTAATPHVKAHKVHRLPAVTIEGAIKCDGERLPLTDPFTGRDAWYCRVK